MRTAIAVTMLLAAGCDGGEGGDDAGDVGIDAGRVDGGGDVDAGGSDAGRDTDAGRPIDAGPITISTEARSIPFEGSTRTFVITRPDPTASGLPLVIALHGDGGSGAGMRASLNIEGSMSAVFVYPDSADSAFEYWSDDGRAREGRFVEALIAMLSAELGIDTGHVFLAGFSGGATMANALGCRLGRDVIHGLGIHSGTLYPVDVAAGGQDFTYTGSGGVSCALPPAIFVWGVSDRTGGVSFADGESVFDNYLRTHSCASTTMAWDIAPCIAYDGCAYPMTWCPIEGMGHAIWTSAGAAMATFFVSLP